MGDVVIDRSRISHRESNAVLVMQVKLKKAQRDLDAEMIEDVLGKIDAMVEKIVVKVPGDWFVEGDAVKFGDPGWLGGLRQDKYEEVLKAMNPQVAAQGN